MDLNSIEEIEGFSELKIGSKIRKIEKKLLILSRMPYLYFSSVIVYPIIMFWLGQNLENFGTIIFIGILIFSVDQNNVHRTELLKELFQLKYEK